MQGSDWLTTLLVGTALGGLAGFVASLLANATYSHILRPGLVIELDPSNPDPVTRPSVGPHAFYHALVVSSSRRVPILGHLRIPRIVRAQVTIMDTARRVTHVDAPARWAGWPEPTALVPIPGAGGVAVQRFADPREIARQRSFDFEAPGQREQIDIALKIENNNEIYFWNNASYQHGATYTPHTLGLGDYYVRVTVLCEGQTKLGWFQLSNNGPSWRDVTLTTLPH